MVSPPARGRRRLRPHGTVFVVYRHHVCHWFHQADYPHCDAYLVTHDSGLAHRLLGALRALRAHEIAADTSQRCIAYDPICAGCSPEVHAVLASVFLRTSIARSGAIAARGVDTERFYVNGHLGAAATTGQRARVVAWLHAALPADAGRIAV